MIAAITILPDNASVAAPVAILIRPDCCAVFAVLEQTLLLLLQLVYVHVLFFLSIHHSMH